MNDCRSEVERLWGLRVSNALLNGVAKAAELQDEELLGWYAPGYELFRAVQLEEKLFRKALKDWTAAGGNDGKLDEPKPERAGFLDRLQALCPF